uniref:Uncharacterized protein n=1 Tax=Cacopsylla melanoneura TaxID=428564 RepID=A0A8D9DU77_9HEMI
MSKKSPLLCISHPYSLSSLTHLDGWCHFLWYVLKSYVWPKSKKQEAIMNWGMEIIPKCIFSYITDLMANEGAFPIKKESAVFFYVDNYGVGYLYDCYDSAAYL